MRPIRRRLYVGLLLAVSIVGTACRPGTEATGSKKSTHTANRAPFDSHLPPSPIPSPTSTDTAPSPSASAPLPPSVAPSVTPSLPPNTPALSGFVMAPAAIISNNGGGILANNGAGVIGNNGGNIISDKGGSLIGNNGAGYRTLAAGTSAPLVDAFLYLTNRDEKFFFNAESKQVFTANTDAKGAFSFPITQTNGFPVGKDVIVNALLNDNQRLTGYLVPKDGVNTFQVDLASTLCTEFLRGEAYRSGKALSSYDPATFYALVDKTQQALDNGNIPASAQAKDAAGQAITVSAFSLQLNSVEILRNQYALAISAASKADTLIKAISDGWKALFGRRPLAVTTLAGNGSLPKVNIIPAPPGITGDWRNGTSTPLRQVPLGWIKQVAVAKRGDIFISADGPDQNDAHIRWIKPDGSITSLWLPNWTLSQVQGLVVEKEPTDDPNNPGSLLVTGGGVALVFRVYLVDTEVRGTNGQPKWPTEIAYGAYVPVDSDPAHPVNVDGSGAYPDPDGSTPKLSFWQLSDEGERTYLSNGQKVPNPARYAHYGTLWSIAYDDLGNTYLSDTGNHRIRMIPKVDGNYYGYRQPYDDDADGIVDRYGAPVTMKAGCVYTIAGDPTWDASRTDPSALGRWFGEYAGDGGPAQQAKLDSPEGLAFSNGYLYVADTENQRIRRLSRTSGVIETVTGNPAGGQVNDAGTHNYHYQPGYAGDGGPATQAQLSNPEGVALDAHGRLFIADTGYGRIRMVDTNGTITTVAGQVRTTGDGKLTHTDDGDALNWETLYGLRQLTLDNDGNLLFSDGDGGHLRKLWFQWE